MRCAHESFDSFGQLEQQEGGAQGQLVQVQCAFCKFSMAFVSICDFYGELNGSRGAHSVVTIGAPLRAAF